jgi:hypothetical protein
MNERIRELFRKAESTTNEGIGLEGKEYTDMLMEKFAELIVKECMDVAKYHTPETEECEYTWLIHNKIKEHFGVTE